MASTTWARYGGWVRAAVIAWVTVLGGWTLATNIQVSSPSPREAFTFLMVLHGGAYALGHIMLTRRARLAYFAAQSVLVLGISAFARDALLTAGLSLPLVGEALITLGISTLGLLVAASYVASDALVVYWLRGVSPLTTSLIAFALPLPFIIAVALFVVRSNQTREQAEARLRALEATFMQERLLAKERQRMARELHDTLVQGVAGIVLQLEAADAHLAVERSARAREIVKRTMTCARTTLTEARTAIDDLRSTAMAPDSGSSDLAAVVEAEVERFHMLCEIPCAVEVHAPIVVPQDVRKHVARMIAEGLTNVARHAGARRAWVRVRSSSDLSGMAGGILEVEVGDDGDGFDPASQPVAGHYGLVGLRERARLAGGEFDIASAPGAGTRLRLRTSLSLDHPE